MTKATSIIVFFAGIIAFALFVCTANTNRHAPKIVVDNTVQVISESSPTTFSGDIDSIVPVKAKKSVVRTASHKVSHKPVTVSYKHTLEQGGSPTAQTVKVTEYL